MGQMGKGGYICLLFMFLIILWGTAEIGLTIGFVDVKTLAGFLGALHATMNKDPVAFVRFFPLSFAMLLVCGFGQLVDTLVAALAVSILAIWGIIAIALELLRPSRPQTKK